MRQFIVNVKVYENVLKDPISFISPLLKTRSDHFQIAFAVPAFNIQSLSKSFGENVMGQHVDLNPYGPFTGSVPMESLISMGIKSSLLNHSERRIEREVIFETVKKAKKLDFGLVVCCESLREIEVFSSNGANVIAYEPPELIGGDISVSTSKPDIIMEGVKVCRRNGATLFVGAGVKTREDVEKSLEQGAEGILISSGITKAKDPLTALNSLTLS